MIPYFISCNPDFHLEGLESLVNGAIMVTRDF